MTKTQLESLFEKAALNLKRATIVGGKPLGKGKLFELYALVVLLRKLRRSGHKVYAHTQPLGTNMLRLALNPASADKSTFSYFDIRNQNDDPCYEAWVSVEVETVSTEMATKTHATAPTGPATKHEIDIGVYDQGIGAFPNFRELCLGVSCKNSNFTKEHLREALGLRRETAWLQHMHSSKAPWYVQDVPCNPASPFILFSSDRDCLKYRQPVDMLGLYVHDLKYP